MIDGENCLNWWPRGCGAAVTNPTLNALNGNPKPTNPGLPGSPAHDDRWHLTADSVWTEASVLIGG